MTDLSQSIAPKSDQLNADDLISGPRTIVITDVRQGNAEQPIAVRYQGDDNKPWYPCKSMRRLMVALWGADGSAYKGRSLTLFRDPKVKWGGIEVGGIRISHMSHIEQDERFMLTATRGKREPYLVRKLEPAVPFDLARVIATVTNAATKEDAFALAGAANVPQQHKRAVKDAIDEKFKEEK